MPKPKTTDAPAPTDQATIDSLSLDELRARAAQALQHLHEARRLLPGLVRMLDSERKHTDGRLRDGESQKLGVVLDLADEHPAYVKPLADKDQGRDPTRFETALLRDRFVRRDILAPVAAEAGKLQGSAPAAPSPFAMNASMASAAAVEQGFRRAFESWT